MSIGYRSQKTVRDQILENNDIAFIPGYCHEKRSLNYSIYEFGF